MNLFDLQRFYVEIEAYLAARILEERQNAKAHLITPASMGLEEAQDRPASPAGPGAVLRILEEALDKGLPFPGVTARNVTHSAYVAPDGDNGFVVGVASPILRSNAPDFDADHLKTLAREGLMRVVNAPDPGAVVDFFSQQVQKGATLTHSEGNRFSLTRCWRETEITHPAAFHGWAKPAPRRTDISVGSHFLKAWQVRAQEPLEILPGGFLDTPENAGLCHLRCTALTQRMPVRT